MAADKRSSAARQRMHTAPLAAEIGEDVRFLVRFGPGGVVDAP